MSERLLNIYVHDADEINSKTTRVRKVQCGFTDDAGKFTGITVGLESFGRSVDREFWNEGVRVTDPTNEFDDYDVFISEAILADQIDDFFKHNFEEDYEDGGFFISASKFEGSFYQLEHEDFHRFSHHQMISLFE